MRTIEPNSYSLNEQNLKYWYTIHTSLDVVEEKLKKTEFKDLYLGLLYLIEDYRIYGYVTNTRIKFLIIIETSNQQYHDTEIKIMFKKLHSCYINSVCSPFYDIGSTIKSKKFDELVKSLMLKTVPAAAPPPTSVLPASAPAITNLNTTTTTSTSSSQQQQQQPVQTAPAPQPPTQQQQQVQSQQQPQQTTLQLNQQKQSEYTV